MQLQMRWVSRNCLTKYSVRMGVLLSEHCQPQKCGFSMEPPVNSSALVTCEFFWLFCPSIHLTKLIFNLYRGLNRKFIIIYPCQTGEGDTMGRQNTKTLHWFLQEIKLLSHNILGQVKRINFQQHGQKALTEAGKSEAKNSTWIFILVYWVIKR